MRKLNKTIFFVGLTFIISWLIAGLYALYNHGRMQGISASVLAICYMFIPALSAIFIEKVVYKNEIRRNLLISFEINKWFLLSVIIPLFILGLTILFSLLIPGVYYSPEMNGFFQQLEKIISPEELRKVKSDLHKLPVHPALLWLVQGIVAGMTINAVAGFGEELGWRGFLVHMFQNFSFLKSAFIIGIVWGFWHAPLILMGHNYPQHPQLGVFLMTILCILLSPIFLYVTIKTKSVIAVSVLHGVINGTFGIAATLVEGGSDITVGTAGLAGLIAIAVTVLILFLIDLFSGEKVMLNKVSRYL